MIRLLVLLVLAGASALPAFSQIWVEDLKFNQNQLDTTKWSYTHSIGPYPVITYSTSFLNVSGQALGGMHGFGSFRYLNNAPLPLSQSWSVLLRLRGNPIENRSGGTELVVGNGSNTLRLGSSLNLWQETSSFGVETSLANDWFWLGISYDYDLRTIYSLYALNSGLAVPNYSEFKINAGTLSVVGHEDTSMEVIGFSYQIGPAGSADLDYTDFKIVPYSVPEPSSLSLLLAGGVVFMAGRRRKRD